jgi:hypothetical protein
VFPALVRRTLFVTPGCHCDRCVQLRLPLIFALARAMHAIACAALLSNMRGRR